MAGERPRIVAHESDEDKKRKKAESDQNTATGLVIPVSISVLNDYIRSEEFKLRLAKDFNGVLGFLASNEKDMVCNIIYTPPKSTVHKSIAIALTPVANDEGTKKIGNALSVKSTAEDEESLTLMIFVLAASLKKFSPQEPLKVKLQPKDENAKKIMEAACKKYGLTIVESLSFDKKPAPGASLKVDKPIDDLRPRLVGKL